MSRVLLVLLIEHLAQGDEPLVFGIDETLERRRGSRISARGVFRDAVRSSESHLVKASGLRWVSLMWLTHIPWANRTWALPVLTALAPAESYHQKVGRPHKKITDWARQMIIQLRRWLPDRRIVRGRSARTPARSHSAEDRRRTDHGGALDEPQAQIIDLMAALRASIGGGARGSHGGTRAQGCDGLKVWRRKWRLPSTCLVAPATLSRRRNSLKPRGAPSTWLRTGEPDREGSIRIFRKLLH